jgi:hypothetical protein
VCVCFITGGRRRLFILSTIRTRTTRRSFDDIKVVGNKKDCEAVVHELAKHVKVENKGPVKSFLGIDVIRDFGINMSSP